MKNKILYKKHGGIGETINWIVAFPLIIVILILFVFVSGVLAKKNNLLTENEIKLSTSTNNALNSERLFVLLNAPLDNGKTIKEGIIEWKISTDKEFQKEIKKKIEDKLNEVIKNICNKTTFEYVFFADYEPGEGKEWYIASGTIPHGDYQFSFANIFYNDKKINVKFYSRTC